jgi:MFS family permease
MGLIMVARVLGLLVVWAVSALLLWWGRLPGRWRRAAALLASAAGVVFLMLAMKSEGLRESQTVSVFLLGTPQVMTTASAASSLSYYVLTGVCLLLGFAGLAAGDGVARALGERWMATAIALSLAVTALRFGLEKAAAPASWTQAVGVTWLAPVVGAFFALSLRAEGKGWRGVAAALFVYGLAVRGAIAGLMVVASLLHLGSHYDVTPMVLVRMPFTERLYGFEPGTVSQVMSVAVVPQLVFWTVYTVIAGLLGARIALLLTPPSGSPALGRPKDAERTDSGSRGLGEGALSARVAAAVDVDGAASETDNGKEGFEGPASQPLLDERLPGGPRR